MDLGEVSLLDTEPLPVEGEPPVRPSFALVFYINTFFFK